MAEVGNADIGVSVLVVDEEGNPPKQRYHGMLSFMTGQKPPEGEESREWLKEVYIADNEKEMEELKNFHRPSGFENPGCSVASQQVTVVFMDDEKNPAKVENHWALSRGVYSDEKGKFVADTIVVGHGKMPQEHPYTAEWNSAVSATKQFLQKNSPLAGCDG